MCFNKETSLGVYIVGMCCSLYLINRGVISKNKDDIMAGSLLFLIAQMQIIEYFLWKNQTCNKINKLCSLFIVVLLWLQPLLYYCVCYLFNKDKLSFTTKRSHLILLLFGSLLFLYCFIYIINNDKNICSLADKATCRLSWSPMEYIYNHKILCH